ncbi:uncharacterized protein LMH87_007986 [Akanthomyces muscarius]|uniref:Uncharacterized protein n=1 Tax=Akanthomyces muscarius TaxID=2231603 RepID=A0A9W8QJW9_AKAMU|nr:uncharacterized protein LMH87_007986 [Akanthomyces muscarius]KAJ4160054.1 hypothetical protein LMH87_007986 [Akanthomyces muscarius]
MLRPALTRLCSLQSPVDNRNKACSERAYKEPSIEDHCQPWFTVTSSATGSRSWQSGSAESKLQARLQS